MSPATANRRGYTLVELMLVIVLVAIVLGSVAALIGGTWRANRATRDHAVTVSAIQRLAMQFRDDVHAAASVNTADDKLIVELPDEGTVTYQLEQGCVRRIVRSADKVLHRDDFTLPPESIIEFETPAAASEPSPSGRGQGEGAEALSQKERELASKPSIVRLNVTYPLATIQPEYSNRRTLRIEAAVGISLTTRSHAPRGNALPRRSASRTTE